MAVTKVSKSKRKPKELSLLHKVVHIYWHRVKVARAERILFKQTWSIELLSRMLVMAAKTSGDYTMQLVITNKDGMSVTLTCDKALRYGQDDGTETILDKLDNDAAVAEFIKRNTRR